MISFLVLSILIIENKGPITSLKLSTQMLKDSWGEQLIGHFSFGLIFAFLSIPIVLLVVFAFQAGDTFAIAGLTIGIFLMIGMGVVQWSLQSIFMGAHYLYVREDSVPSTFSLSQIQNAVR